MALAVLLILCSAALAEGLTILDEVASAPLEPEVEEQAIELTGDDGLESDTVESNNVIANAGDVAIDATNFPDANFRAYVQSEFDKDGSGILSQAEIDSAEIIDCADRAIASLKGIELFTKTIYLNCSSNELTALDVKTNTALMTLYCESNKLTALDVSHNTALTVLGCSDNQLTALDVSHNPALQHMKCFDNQLTMLDICNNADLEYLDCANNRIAKLDIQKCPKLLECYQNGPSSIIEGIAIYNNPGNYYLCVDVSAWIKTDDSPDPIFTFELTKNTKHEVYYEDRFQITLGDKKAEDFKSSNEAVANVTAGGLVTPVKAGKVKITAVLENRKKLTLTLTVTDTVKPKVIVINAPGVPYIGLKDKLPLTVTMTGDRPNVSAKLKWKSLNARVAKVDKNGVVTGKKPGTATITVTTDNKLTASADIEVRDIHAPTSVTIVPASVEPIPVKGTVKLTAVMTAEGEPQSKLKWTSKNTRVAKVDKNGLVTGKKPGTATIVVTTANKKTASVEVTVQ